HNTKASGQPSVYHMDDTDISTAMALMAEIHQPRIAMVPIGDRFTMGAATAAMAIKRFFKLDAVIPCHYGSFPIIDATADKFVAAMRGHATKGVVPGKGKAVAPQCRKRLKKAAPGLNRALRKAIAIAD